MMTPILYRLLGGIAFISAVFFAGLMPGRGRGDKRRLINHLKSINSFLQSSKTIGFKRPVYVVYYFVFVETKCP